MHHSKTYNLLLLTFILFFASCSNWDNSNKLGSGKFDTKEERVKVLTNEIKAYSTIEDCEFDLFNVNGFSNERTSVPGASSWNYQFALKIDPTDIDAWTVSMIKYSPPNYDDRWTQDILGERATNWEINSEPEYYTRKGENVMMLVYRTEGFIFKKVINE